MTKWYDIQLCVHYFLVYTLSGIHILETVAKPMLQMLETQRESSSKRVQNLQSKLDRLTLGINDETLCDGEFSSNDNLTNLSENIAHSSEVASAYLQTNETKKEKKSGMVSSPV